MVVMVEADFIPDPQAYKEDHGHAGGESGDVDEAEYFIFSEVAKRNPEE